MNHREFRALSMPLLLRVLTRATLSSAVFGRSTLSEVFGARHTRKRFLASFAPALHTKNCRLTHKERYPAPANCSAEFFFYATHQSVSYLPAPAPRPRAAAAPLGLWCLLACLRRHPSVSIVSMSLPIHGILHVLR